MELRSPDSSCNPYIAFALLIKAVYDNGAKAAMGNFAAYNSVAGLGTVREVFFDPVNKLVSGNATEQAWIDGIKAASDQMRANLK